MKKLNADFSNISSAYQYILDSESLEGLDKRVTFDIRLAVEEAMTNIIEHGYKGNGGDIEIEASRQGNAILIHIKDKGIPFDPTKAPEPDFSLSLWDRKPGGAGIFLMLQSMDEVKYTSEAGENTLILKKQV